MWSEEYESSFQRLNELLTITIIQIFSVKGKGFIVYFDAARTSLGCVM